MNYNDQFASYDSIYVTRQSQNQLWVQQKYPMAYYLYKNRLLKWGILFQFIVCRPINLYCVYVTKILASSRLPAFLLNVMNIFDAISAT